jgi:hypothetical protein
VSVVVKVDTPRPRDDSRTFLGDFVTRLTQIEFPGGLSLQHSPPPRVSLDRVRDRNRMEVADDGLGRRFGDYFRTGRPLVQNIFRFRNAVVIPRLVTFKFVRSLTLRNGIRQNHVTRPEDGCRDIQPTSSLAPRQNCPLG